MVQVLGLFVQSHQRLTSVVLVFFLKIVKELQDLSPSYLETDLPVAIIKLDTGTKGLLKVLLDFGQELPRFYP